MTFVRHRIVLVGMLLAIAGCDAAPPLIQLKPSTSQGAQTPAPLQYGSIVGTIRATAGLISNNSAGLISNNSAGLISNNSAGLISNNSAGLVSRAYQLQALTEEPLVGAEVYLADASGKPIPGLASSKTDDQGHYAFPSVPAGFSFVVVVPVKTAQGDPQLLKSLTHSTASTVRTDVSVTTTLVTSAVLPPKEATLPGKFDQAAFDRATAAMAERLRLGELPNMADRAAVVAKVGALAEGAPDLQSAIGSLSQDLVKGEQPIDAALSGAGSASPAPAATPSPQPSAVSRAYQDPVLLAGGGNNQGAFQDGLGAAARFNNPLFLAVDAQGTVYVSDLFNHAIRKVDAAGNVTTLAGNGTRGYQDGPLAIAKFSGPAGIALDADGNLYVADDGNNRIRKITPAGVVSTVAGRGVEGLDDGLAFQASFTRLGGLALDPSGNLYILDTNRLRKLDPAGKVSTVATIENLYSTPGMSHNVNRDSLAVDADGNLYANDGGKLVKVAPDGRRTVMSTEGFSGLALDAQGNTLTVNGAVQKLDREGRRSFVGNLFTMPSGLAVDAAGNVYVGDPGKNAIFKIAPR